MRGRKARKKAAKPYCVISHKAVNRSWFATEAEAIEHASTLDAKREAFYKANGARGIDSGGGPTEFAIVRVTATVGPKPPVEPPVVVTYFK